MNSPTLSSSAGFLTREKTRNIWATKGAQRETLNIKKKTHIGGSQKGGFQKGGFGGCSPGTKTGTRVRSPKPPFWKPPFYLPVTLFGDDKRVVSKRGVSADVPPEPKTGTRVRSPKPPFYETALLSPNEHKQNFHGIVPGFLGGI